MDLQFLAERLPSPANLPDPATLLGWHRDLIAARSLTDAITNSEPLTRRVIARLGLEEAEKLESNLKGLRSRPRDSILQSFADGKNPFGLLAFRGT